MSYKNEERCPKLRDNGVALNQAGYSSGGGQGSPLRLEQRNGIKDLCLECMRGVCVYDEKGVHLNKREVKSNNDLSNEVLVSNSRWV